MTEQERKQIAFMGYLLQKLILGSAISVEEVKALDNILLDLGHLSVDYTDFV